MIPHDIIMNCLKEDIICVKTLTLIERALKIGIIDTNGRHLKAKIGTPQGSVISPLLANIVLNKLDKYLEEDLKPNFEIGAKRSRNKEYDRLSSIRRTSNLHRTTPEERRAALEKMRTMSKLNMQDPNFKRLMYVRYADDFVILVSGTRSDALLIRDKVEVFLKTECGLTLNLEKTIVSSLRRGFNFLGAQCIKRDNKSTFNKSKNQLTRNITRRSTLRLAVDAPILSIINKLISNGFARRNKKGSILAKGITHLIHLEHSDILNYFNSKIIGLLNYYSFAGNRSSLHRVF